MARVLIVEKLLWQPRLSRRGGRRHTFDNREGFWLLKPFFVQWQGFWLLKNCLHNRPRVLIVETVFCTMARVLIVEKLLAQPPKGFDCWNRFLYNGKGFDCTKTQTFRAYKNEGSLRDFRVRSRGLPVWRHLTVLLYPWLVVLVIKLRLASRVSWFNGSSPCFAELAREFPCGHWNSLGTVLLLDDTQHLSVCELLACAWVLSLWLCSGQAC